jgi:hypothetical protein
VTLLVGAGPQKIEVIVQLRMRNALALLYGLFLRHDVLQVEDGEVQMWLLRRR